MLKSYLKIASRHLVKNKVYSFINIGGLAVGMAVAVLIGLWVKDELAFDKYHKNYDSIAQVRRYYTDPNTHETNGLENMHYPMATLLKSDYKQYFKHVVIAWWLSDYSLSKDEKKMSRRGEFMDAEGL